MTRDELILSCQETVSNLVRKYNNHQPDEDLQAVGMTSVIECVDRSLYEGLTDVDQIQRRCNTWARNVILKEIYKEKIKYVDDNSPLEYLETEEDLWETIEIVKTVLTPRELDVFELLVEGASHDEIMAKLNIKKSVLYDYTKRIKYKIKNLDRNFEGV